jgi:hypothetical protein
MPPYQGESLTASTAIDVATIHPQRAMEHNTTVVRKLHMLRENCTKLNGHTCGHHPQRHIGAEVT